MKKLFTVLALLIAVGANAQTFMVKDNGHPGDTKLKNTLRFEEFKVVEDNPDYTLELFFAGNYMKGRKGYYKIYDKEGKEIHKSKTWALSGYGGVAENQTVKKVIKDLRKLLKEAQL